jgi:peptide/nickel transport system ATP-binding protein
VTSSLTPASATPLLEINDLTVSFGSEAGPVRAVRGVTYSVQPG